VTSDYPGVSGKKCEKNPGKLEKPRMTEQITSPGFVACVAGVERGRG